MRIKVGASVVLALVAALFFNAPALASAYTSSVLSDSPSDYYTLDGGPGVLAGLSLTAAGTVPFTTGCPVAGCAQVMVGNNASGYMVGTSAGVSGMVGSGGMTVEAWLLCSSCGGDEIFAAYGAGCSRLEIRADSSYGQGGCGANGTNCSTLASSTFHLFDWVFPVGGTMSVYRDGVSCGSGGSSLIGVGTYCAWIGGDGNSTPGGCVVPNRRQLGTNEKVSNLAVYPSVLSGTRILAHFNSAAGGPGAHVTCNLLTTTLVNGDHTSATCTTVDAFGTDVTATDDYSVYGVHDRTGALAVQLALDPSGGPTTLGAGVSTFDVAGLIQGIWVIQVRSAFHSGGVADWFGIITVSGATSQFTLLERPGTAAIGQPVTFYDLAYDASGNDISTSDTWSINNTDADRTCGTAYSLGTAIGIQCSWSTVGTKTVTASDHNGFPGSATVTIVSGSPSGGNGACGTISIAGTTWPDLGCWAQNIWNQVTDLPGTIGQAIFGGSLDQTVVSAALLPTVNCRSGQPSDAPDGVHCWPFPLSIPFDLLQIASVIDVTPVAPVLSAHLHAPPIDQTFTIDPTVVMTPTVMSWVYAVEMTLFTVALAFGAYRLWEWVQSVLNQ